MLIFTLPLILAFFIGTTDCLSGGNRVLLRDITALTLQRGEYTTGRRSAPVPQLQCTGGSAKGKFSPQTVQCYNRGFDGRDVQWECKAELGAYKFGKIDVNCEGFEYPDDPFILAGSCGLRYELDYADYARKTEYSPSGVGNSIMMLVLVAIVLFVLYLIYTSITGGPNVPGARSTGSSSGWWPGGGGGGGGGDGPPPYGWSPPPPPPYNTRSSGGPKTGSSGSTNDSGPGFWTGAGLGVLGGYLFGSGDGGNTGPRRRWGGYNYGYDTTHHHDYDNYDQPSTSSAYYTRRSSPPSSSNTNQTSSGFGGTSRR